MGKEYSGKKKMTERTKTLWRHKTKGKDDRGQEVLKGKKKVNPPTGSATAGKSSKEGVQGYKHN